MSIEVFPTSDGKQTAAGAPPDPITAEVVRCAYDNIAEEMALVLVRTSGSPALTEAKDFSTIVFNRAGEQIGSAGYILLHLASSRIAVEALVEQRGDEIEPGDAYICNDPHTNGALHQADVGIIMPIFLDKELIGWTFANAHLIDVGGASLGGMAPTAYDCFEEAVRFPLTRIAKNGIIDPEWERFVGLNFRAPVPFVNDVRSLIAACRAGGERVLALADEYGVETLETISAHNMNLSEQALKARISELPSGVSSTHEWVEYDGRGTPELYELFAEMRAENGTLNFRFSGREQVPCFINGAQGGIEGNTISPILVMLAYDIPFNEGIWRCINIDRGEPGTIVNPVNPAPVSNAHMETGAKIARMVSTLISDACSASDSSLLRSRAAGQASSASTGTAWFGTNREGNLSVFFPMDLAVAIGGPAQTVADGQDVYGYQSTLSIGFPDIETHELSEPVLILWRRLNVNSGGPGQRRGGQGLDSSWILWGGGDHSCFSFQSCCELPGRGYGGGFPGGAGFNHLIRGSNIRSLIEEGKIPTSADQVDGTLDPMPGKGSNIPFRNDEVYFGKSCGGGGLGDPFLRPPDFVHKDVLEGRVTQEVAEKIYGAQFNEGGGIDHDGTWRKRDEVRSNRVSTKKVPLKTDNSLSGQFGAVPLEKHWVCSNCRTPISPIATPWKSTIEPQRNELVAIFEESGQFVRAREDKPVIFAERFCSNCGALLSTDLEVTGDTRTPSGFVFKNATDAKSH